MADGARQDVLGRKAQAAQRAFEARGMSPAKALRRALSRSADLLWDLALVSQGEQLETLDQDGVIEGLDPKALLLLLDGPDGALGLVSVDREVMTGVIEVQTIQQVTTLPVEDRPLTPTDAAMMAPLIDATLEMFTRNLSEHPLYPQLEGYRFGAMVEDARSAGLLLDASSYRAFRVTLDLALGRRRGVLSVILPERVIPRPGPQDQQNAEGPGPHAALMERLPVRLDAVLGRVSMPLAKAQTLKVGDLLDLPSDALDALELRAATGKLVARGRIGQMNGMRAVRINWPAGTDGAAAVATGSVLAAPEMVPDPFAVAPDPPAAMEAFGALGDADDFQNTMDDTPVPDLPDFPQAETEETLPDLPALDLGDEAAFDFSAVDAAMGSEGEEDGFAPAVMDFDLES